MSDGADKGCTLDTTRRKKKTWNAQISLDHECSPVITVMKTIAAISVRKVTFVPITATL